MTNNSVHRRDHVVIWTDNQVEVVTENQNTFDRNKGINYNLNTRWERESIPHLRAPCLEARDELDHNIVLDSQCFVTRRDNIISEDFNSAVLEIYFEIETPLNAYQGSFIFEYNRGQGHQLIKFGNGFQNIEFKFNMGFLNLDGFSYVLNNFIEFYNNNEFVWLESDVFFDIEGVILRAYY